MNVRVWISLAVVLVSVYGGNLHAEGLTGDAGRGEDIYRLHCLNCHGARGRGDGPVGESLTPRPADLTTEIVQKKSEKELLQIIREGKPGTSMPPGRETYPIRTSMMCWCFCESLEGKFLPLKPFL